MSYLSLVILATILAVHSIRQEIIILHSNLGDDLYMDGGRYYPWYTCMIIDTAEDGDGATDLLILDSSYEIPWRVDPAQLLIIRRVQLPPQPSPFVDCAIELESGRPFVAIRPHTIKLKNQIVQLRQVVRQSIVITIALIACIYLLVLLKRT